MTEQQPAWLMIRKKLLMVEAETFPKGKYHMITIAIVGVLSGFALGLRFKVWVLIAGVLLGAVAFIFANGLGLMTLSMAALAIVVFGTALQIGYLGASLLVQCVFVSR